MKKVVMFLVLVFFASVVMISCEDKAARLAKAKDLLNKRCNKCHFSDKIYQKKYTKEDWNNIVNRMISLSKDSPDRQKFEISHDDAFEILIFLQEESGE